MVQYILKLKLTKTQEAIINQWLWNLTGVYNWVWVCAACGAVHDRDVNAAVNTLVAGLGESHETLRESGPKSYTSLVDFGGKSI